MLSLTGDVAARFEAGADSSVGGGILEGDQHVREKFTCRDCEKISQAPAPFHVIARGWAGPSLLGCCKRASIAP